MCGVMCRARWGVTCCDKIVEIVRHCETAPLLLYLYGRQDKTHEMGCGHSIRRRKRDNANLDPLAEQPANLWDAFKTVTTEPPQSVTALEPGQCRVSGYVQDEDGKHSLRVVNGTLEDREDGLFLSLMVLVDDCECFMTIGPVPDEGDRALHCDMLIRRADEEEYLQSTCEEPVNVQRLNHLRIVEEFVSRLYTDEECVEVNGSLCWCPEVEA